jgi:hypothetical protein
MFIKLWVQISCCTMEVVVGMPKVQCSHILLYHGGGCTDAQSSVFTHLFVPWRWLYGCPKFSVHISCCTMEVVVRMPKVQCSHILLYHGGGCTDVQSSVFTFFKYHKNAKYGVIFEVAMADCTTS